MDRFIDVINLLANYNTENLKSNMDRFIASTAQLPVLVKIFKIQYG